MVYIFLCSTAKRYTNFLHDQLSTCVIQREDTVGLIIQVEFIFLDHKIMRIFSEVDK